MWNDKKLLHLSIITLSEPYNIFTHVYNKQHRTKRLRIRKTLLKIQKADDIM